MFILYYLADQYGDVTGDKIYVNVFDDLQSAKDKANSEAVQHYSIEQKVGDNDFTIVFVC